jgi:DNA-directed RNA polymerase specialized sigma24 family protein
MSPLPLRRYRAERLLREQFEQLRRSVVVGVAARLRAVGVQLDDGDLEASYSQAWQGLYASVLEGAEIASPEAWLTLVTYRRALDEHRARVRVKRVAVDPAGDSAAAALFVGAAAAERDLADELDDRVRLRHLFEGLRARLSEREQQAATLCYLQGLSRAEAATRMGVSEKRMRKLMEGRGDGAPGVARKVGNLVETIDGGRWCEEQGSLMRGFAYGVLDPTGERYELAELHHSECPGCRAYVLSLRGIAAVLPPIPALLAPLFGSSAVGALAASGSVGGGGAAAGSTASAGGVAPAGSAVGASALSASGAAGAGAAGGGWWLAGPLGAKLAAGCLLAFGVGAGCAALGGGSGGNGADGHRHEHSSAAARVLARAHASDGTASAVASGPLARESSAVEQAQAVQPSVAPSAQAAREFGPEQAAEGSGTGARSASAASRATAHTASSGRSSDGQARAASESSSGSSIDVVPARAASSGVPAAQREFAPG